MLYNSPMWSDRDFHNKLLLFQLILLLTTWVFMTHYCAKYWKTKGLKHNIDKYIGINYSLKVYIKIWDLRIEIPEVWMSMISGLLRELFPPLKMPTMLWIENCWPWVRVKIHQTLTTTVVLRALLSKSTLAMKTCFTQPK